MAETFRKLWALPWLLWPLLAGCAGLSAERSGVKTGNVIEARRPLRPDSSANARYEGSRAPLRAPVVGRTNGKDAAEFHSSTGGIPADHSKAIRTGRGLKAKDAYGVTALMRAAEQGQVDEVEALVAGGANVNARSEGGLAPLMYAVRGGQLAVVQALANHGADLNATDDMGMTPLMQAAFSGRLDIVQLLVEKGADVNATGETTFLPLEYAGRGGHEKIAAFLQAHGATE